VTQESENIQHRDGDVPTRFAVGIADGFAEASRVLARELDKATSGPELIGTSMAAFLKANARFLEEVADVVRRTTDDHEHRSRVVADETDFEGLADVVAERLRGDEQAEPGP
jgi:hypothetical protein